MKLERPKRKATANKSYVDSIDETLKNDDDYAIEHMDGPDVVKTASSNRSNSLKNESVPASPTKRQPFAGPSIPYNWQALPRSQDYFSQRLDLTDAYIDITQQALYCPNHTTNIGDSQKKRPGKLKVQKGDYIYMVSEPPGEPYYIGRVMGFKAKSKVAESSIGNARDYMLKIQWFYRPRDVSRGTSDSRLLFASMHSDTCPISSFRGLVTVKHKYDIEQEYLAQQAALKSQQTKKGTSKPKVKSMLSSQTPNYLEEYSEHINCFYFDKLFDRYMIKFYDVLPTKQLLQYSHMEECKSRNFLVALHKRFEYIFVEPHHTKIIHKTFSSKACNCEKCGQWCASAQDSINCVLCLKHYHMMCLDPPLLKKPSRGFSWSCAQCTKKHDLELQSKSPLMLSHDNKSSNASQLARNITALKMDVDDTADGSGDSQDAENSETTDTACSGVISLESTLPKYELKAQEFLRADDANTFEQRRLLEEWSMRYLGLHARLEDGVDMEDRSPYPRASTRLGAKNQASSLPEFNGHPIVYYDPEPKAMRKNAATHIKKAGGKNADIPAMLLVPQEYADSPPLEYPDWLQPRPKGYIERGVDEGPHCTSTLLWKPMQSDIEDSFNTLDSYMLAVGPVAEAIGIPPKTPNFLDAALFEYLNSNGDTEKALNKLSKWTKKSLKEPIFNREEVKRFEKGVKEFGSELHQVQKVVKSQPISLVVRFYYVWKKTELGKRIWGNFDGRAQKKLQKANKDDSTKSENLLDASIGGEDDSSYDYEKTIDARVSFSCKFCHTKRSIQWFRVTGHEANVADHASNECVALCFRCAKLWRRYAVTWEDSQLLEKNSKSYGWRRKIEFELSHDAQNLRKEAELRHAFIDYDYEEPAPVRSMVPIIAPDTMASSRVSKTPTKAAEKALKKSTLIGDAKPATKKETVRKEPIKKEPAKKESAKRDSAKKETVKKEVVRKEAVKKEPIKKEPIKDEYANRESKKKEFNKRAPKNVKATALDQDRERSDAEMPTVHSNPSLVNTKKRKIKEEISDSPQALQSKEVTKNGPTKVGSQKRQKKALKDQRTIPFMNQKYEMPHYIPRLDPQNPEMALVNQHDLKIIVDEYRIRQILNNAMLIYNLSQPLTPPHPELISTKSCAVCYDAIDTKLQNEYMHCTSCNVTVHCVCVGTAASNKLPDFMCDACANDIYPLRSTLRQCVLCPGSDDHQHTREPQLLCSISDTGRWCHLQCALFNSKYVEFASRQKRRTHKPFSSKGDLPILESVTRALIANFDHTCKICSKMNGSLLHCTHCGPEHKYHATCAQKSGVFIMGFTLEPAKAKDDKVIRVGTDSGKLVPAILCPDHLQHKHSVLGFHETGERESKTKRGTGQLIELFLQNARAAASNRNGKRCLLSIASERSNASKSEHNGSECLEPSAMSRFKCARCNTSVSPAWWTIDNDGIGGRLFNGSDCERHQLFCHTCYHDRDEDAEIEEMDQEAALPDFIEMLNRPLYGAHYGIQDEHDHIRVPNQSSNIVKGQEVSSSDSVREVSRIQQ